MMFREEYFFLSNFYECPFFVKFPDGRTFQVATLEHAYQAYKFDNVYYMQKMCEARTPGAAKRLADDYKVYVRNGWEHVRVSIMRDLLLDKFHRPLFSKLLLMTGNIPIIEHNHWHDNFWGSCLCGLCNDHGQNNLGRLIQRIRYDLLESERG